METLIFIGLLLLLLFLRIPVYVSLFLTGMFGLVAFTSLELVFVAQTMLMKLQNFTLICIPFFLLLGAVMVAGRSARQLIEVARRLVCWLPGGLAMTSVVSSALFGAISGSGISTVVTVGGVMFPFMKEQGYPRAFSVGLVTSASILGMIIPPSIIMVICALTAGVSVVRLFAAGYLPGAVIALALMIYVYVSVRRQGLAERTTEPFDLRLLGRAVLQAAMPLLIIVVLFAGVYSGAFTVTEASVVACFLAVVTEWLVYRSIDFRTLRTLFVSSGILSGTLVITIAGAGVLSEYITIQGIPQEILEVATSHVPNWIAFMLLVTSVLLVMGTFMDPIASIMILVPILMPIVHQFGIDPIHFCLIVNVALGVGYITPPLGLMLYATAACTGERFMFIVRATFPTLLVYIVVLFVLSVVPWFSTAVPDLLFPLVTP